ncbi:MAG: hypothetical protein IJY67_01765 [Paludibacteraceae bacterium]|nr:hypothetical protein [Paludibacteraceae bacterium]
MKSFKKVFTRLFWSENKRSMEWNADEEATFNVSFGNLLIGTLNYSNGVWHFSYSNDFKLQKEILPLANFPSINKEYETQELWPFFASRIPSNAQLQLDKCDQEENIVLLLSRFGRRTVANPYVLCQIL